MTKLLTQIEQGIEAADGRFLVGEIDSTLTDIPTSKIQPSPFEFSGRHVWLQYGDVMPHDQSLLIQKGRDSEGKLIDADESCREVVTLLFDSSDAPQTYGWELTLTTKGGLDRKASRVVSKLAVTPTKMSAATRKYDMQGGGKEVTPTDPAILFELIREICTSEAETMDQEAENYRLSQEINRKELEKYIQKNLGRFTLDRLSSNPQTVQYFSLLKASESVGFGKHSMQDFEIPEE